MGLRTLIRNWLNEDDTLPEPALKAHDNAVNASPVVDCDENSTFRMSVSRAINGKIITLSTYKRNPHGPDWTHEFYLVRDDERLVDALTVCLAMKTLS